MKPKLLGLLCLILCGVCSQSFATPTWMVRTPCTTKVVPKDKVHLDVDDYFALTHPDRKGNNQPTDIGVEVGLFRWNNLISFEAGVDFLAGTSNPLYFNGKFAIDEYKSFDQAPSVSIGIFNVGTSDHTNQSVIDLIFGKTLPNGYGTVYGGLFHGRHKAFGNHRTGVMAAYERGFMMTKDAAGKEYNKWVFLSDVASGKNQIGGFGAAMVYYFTPTISLETGPTWFNAKKRLNHRGKWKWTIQLDIEI